MSGSPFSKGNMNIFSPNNPLGQTKKGLLPGHTNASTNIANIFQSNSSKPIALGAGTQSPFSVSNMFGGQSPGANQGSNYNTIFGNINKEKGYSPFNKIGTSGNSSVNASGNIFNQSQKPGSSPFSSPFQSSLTQNTGVFKSPYSQPNNTGINFSNLFSQKQSQGSAQGQNLPAYNAQNQGIFGQQSSYSSPFQPQQQNQIILGQNMQQQQQQTSPFQPSPFQQQQQFSPFQPQQFSPFFKPQQPQAGYQQQVSQLPVRVDNAMSSYLNQYRQGLKNKSTSYPQQHQLQRFDPQNKNENYYLFLNNLVSDETIKKFATPQEIFQFAEGWANKVASSDKNGSRQEITKLFDSKIQQPMQTLKELPPIELTPDLLEHMNDPSEARLVLSQLWLHCKAKSQQLLQALVLSDSVSNLSMKVKDLQCVNQLAIMWKQLKILKGSVQQLMERDWKVQRQKVNFNNQVQKRCTLFKQCFIEVNRNNTIIEQAQSEIQVASDYVEKQIKPLYKAFMLNTLHSYQDPDSMILAMASSILSKLTNLDITLSQYFTVPDEQKSINQLQVVQQLCQLYQSSAEELFQVRSKMIKCVEIAARQQFRKGTDVMKKIRQKAATIMDKKLEVYYKLNEIQNILLQRNGMIILQQESNKANDASQISLVPYQNQNYSQTSGAIPSKRQSKLILRPQSSSSPSK